MPVEATIFSAFLVGLLGGVHCAGMCGGLAGALVLGLPQSVRSDTWRVMPYLLAYNAGRVTSYTVAGALMGGIGLLAANMTALHEAQRVLQILAGGFMIALGLYLGGWWLGLRYLEQAGAVLWRRLEPLARRFLPVRNPAGAFAAGLVWGWLPCGLVYSVLFWSIAAGGAWQGGALMLAFGAGTLPLLITLGALASRLTSFVQRPLLRALAGVLVAAYGIYWVAMALRALVLAQ